jgi:hypothetical protein
MSELSEFDTETVWVCSHRSTDNNVVHLDENCPHVQRATNPRPDDVEVWTDDTEVCTRCERRQDPDKEYQNGADTGTPLASRLLNGDADVDFQFDFDCDDTGDKTETENDND